MIGVIQSLKRIAKLYSPRRDTLSGIVWGLLIAFFLSTILTAFDSSRSTIVFGILVLAHVALFLERFYK